VISPDSIAIQHNRLDEPEAVVLLFTSGKLLITGVKTREAIEDSLAVIIDRLEQLGLLDWVRSRLNDQ